jgi:hypothetical protein
MAEVPRESPVPSMLDKGTWKMQKWLAGFKGLI